MKETAARRCSWAGTDPDYIAYHDHEWGVPLHDERALFELLILEGAQAGLSWLTILRKRAGYRAAFDRFDASRMAAYDDAKIARLLANPAIVRNRLKIGAAVTNARAYLDLREARGGLDPYLWDFVDGRAITNRWTRLDQIPAQTPLSDQISKDLKRRGFRFVGPTIVYAYLQSAGLVNDHLTSCFRHKGVSRTSG